MRAAFVDAFGDASAIRWDELPDPRPRPDEVLVAPDAVAVDMVDTYVRSGRWRTPVTFPLVVGRDLAGTVVEAGEAVWEISPGDRVWTSSAGYDSRPGATASGAVGRCAVQVAAAHEAEVTAVGRHAEAGGRLRELGAAHVLSADVAEDVAALAGSADVLVDTTGALDIGSVPGLMAQRGRIILLAGRNRPHLDQWVFYTRELQLLGFVMSGMTATELAESADWINSRHLDHPVHVSIGLRLGLADAARAHQILDSGWLPTVPDGTRGRIVLLR